MDPILNDHNKEEFPPAHTAEHLLNQTMIRLFGCSYLLVIMMSVPVLAGMSVAPLR